MARPEIDKLVTDSIEEINEGFFLDPKIETAANAEILGQFDSMHVVALLVCIEEMVEERLGKQIYLVDDIDLLREGGPLQTVGGLKDYLDKKIPQSAEKG